MVGPFGINAGHEPGRIFLCELTRHSDHHHKASRKYQILRHMDDSLQLPFGYPLSILIALIPPLWFCLTDTTWKASGCSRRMAHSGRAVIFAERQNKGYSAGE